MSYGLVICSICKHEVHQRGDRSWWHCDTVTPMCNGAQAIFPERRTDIKGAWCGADDFDGTMGRPTGIAGPDPTGCAHSPAIVHRLGGKNAKLDNVCGKCGARIVRKVPAGKWKSAESTPKKEPADAE